MKNFIGTKLLKAEPMTHGEYSIKKFGKPTDSEFSKENVNSEGYLVEYADGYISWSPKEVFEKAYMEVSDNNSIAYENIQGFIKDITVEKMGKKTCVVQAVLNNGFTITESAACVDPENYDEEIGKSICMDKIESKIWELLGFLLQTGIGGVK